MYCPKCGTQNEDSALFCRSCGYDVRAAATTGPPRADAASAEHEIAELDVVGEQLREEYEILEELGRGGMAIVFRAKEKQLDREVAIKVLPFSLAFDKEFVERFQREARTSAKLEHPNIIPIYRVGKSGRVIYFIMKFLRGKPLSSQLAARGALPASDIRRILGEVGRALAYAHRSGIVHRDIKPDNIMFDEHGQAVVTDFGIAKAGAGGKLTGTGMAIGTPHYMSPEQARAQTLDGRSDIYSLGVVAYQCLTGTVPFDGEDSFSIGYKHIMEEIPVPRMESQEQRALFDVIKKMMAKKPDERFQDADQLVAALEGGTPVVATGITTAATQAMPSLAQRRLAESPTTPLPGLGARLRRPKRSAAAGVFLWLVIVGATFGGGAYFAYSRGLLDWLLHPQPSPLAAADSGVAQDSVSGLPHAPGSGPAPPGDTSRVVVPAGTPGRLVLSGVPAGGLVLVDGQRVQLVRGSEVDLPPGPHQLAVRVTGYRPFEQQVLITPGNPSRVAVELELAGPGGPGVDPCGEYGPEYNRNNMCWDTRPLPLSPTFIPVPADSPIFPREAILLIHVSATGGTMEARIFVPSNVETFNVQALDMARTLRWHPATKGPDPTDAWVQLRFVPQRQ
jgi:serine/threonine-protein kinase